MKILIIGGTVFLGRYLVESALRSGHEVTLFNRGRHGAELFPQVERIFGDRTSDLKALSGRRWDAVIDTCGYVPRDVLASARALADSVKNYIYISSVSAYREVTPGMDETAPLAQITAEELREAEQIIASDRATAYTYGRWYGPMKALCEQAAETAMPGRVLHVRSALIVGPHDYSDRFTYWVRRVAQGGEVLAPGNSERRVEFTDVRDLSEWIVRMAEREQTGAYHTTGPDYPLTMGRVLEECQAVSGSRASLTWVSEQFLLDNEVKPWSEMPLWLPEEHTGFHALNNSKAMQAGLTFRPLAETIRDTLLWDATRSSVELRSGLTGEREAQLLRAWHHQEHKARSQP
jgi:2'-hydroxyisoflavone reductase